MRRAAPAVTLYGAIAELFRTYAAAFESADARIITALMDPPMLLIEPTASHVIATSDDALQLNDRVVNNYRERGVQGCMAEVEEVELLGVDLCLCTVAWQFSMPGVQSLRFASRYVLRRRPGGWRIASVIAHDEMRAFAERRH